MEELRSTEILDKEIHEDARRKADKILKDAESDCQEIGVKAVASFEKTSESKKAEYEQMLASYKRDSDAAVPLEKQRRLISFIDNSVREALDGWFGAAGAKKKLSALHRLLEKYSAVLTGKRFEVLSRGFSKKDVSELAASVLGKDAELSITELSGTEADKINLSEGFTMRADDGSVFCRVTCDELKNELLQNHRQELAERLLGKEAFAPGRFGEGVSL